MKTRSILYYLSAVLLLAVSCNPSAPKQTPEEAEAIEKKREIEGSYEARNNITATVKAAVETTPVNQSIEEDSADDPAIWINRKDTANSLIIGTDKKAGLVVYNLKGEMLKLYELGKMNNVDVRYDFVIGEDTFDIVAASNRTYNTVDVFKIDAEGTLTSMVGDTMRSNVDKVYGFCLYKSPKSGKLYAFINSKNGGVEQWELTANAETGKIDGKIVRTFTIETQTEGMVADDVNELLFIGEEVKCIWRYNAEPNPEDTVGIRIENSGEENELIKFDIEGLAIYKLDSINGYLIASSQGNFSYAVFDLVAPNKYLGSFYIADGDSIDGVEETDGLEITNVNLGMGFPKGMIVLQDGINMDGDTKKPQNFKYVDWRDLAKAMDLKVVQ